MFSDDDLEQNDQDGAGAADGGGGGEEGYDGAADDAGVDSAFVVSGDKQPLSKGTVAMFLILAAAGAGTYFMYVRSSTQSAKAADPKAQAVIKEFMTQRDKNAQAMKKMLTDTETVVRQFLNHRVQQVPLSALAANPFRTAPANPNEGGGSRLDEELQKRKREEERQAVVKAVGALQLQSVMHSDSRKSCMINNALYLEGQQVEAFVIEKIAPNCVVVRNGQYRFELRMQR